MRRAEEEEAILWFPENERELVRRLVQAERDEIHKDYEKAHFRYRAFLLHIRNDLTKPGLNVDEAKAATKLTAITTYAAEFARIVGLRPYEYIEHHRMQLARKILQHTERTRGHVTRVAYVVGYGDSNLFSRNYGRFAGHPPSKEPNADRRSTIALLEELRISTSLQRPTPGHEKNSGRSVRAFHEDRSTRKIDVNAFWEEIHDLEQEQAFDYFHGNIAALDTQHFDFLLEKSKLEGRRSRERGEEVARMALDCLRAIEFREGRDLFNEKVLGYAVLANALRLRLNFVAAKEAFEAIDMVEPASLKRGVLLHVNVFRAYFLWCWKRDVESSKRMVDSLISEVRNSGSVELLAMSLALAGEIYEDSGQPDRALSMFEERVQCSRFIDDPYVLVGAIYNLSDMYAKLSNGKKASELLEIIKELHEDANFSSSAIYVTLLEARIHRANGDHRNAEPAFLEAREGFRGLGLDLYVALTSLELALLYLDFADPGRAFSMAMSSIECISRYSYHRDAMIALAVLQEASRTSIVNKTMLRRALRHLELVRKDPKSAFLAQ